MHPCIILQINHNNRTNKKSIIPAPSCQGVHKLCDINLYFKSKYKTTHQIVSLHHYKRSRVKYSAESTDISFPPGSVSGPRRLTPSPATLNLAKHKASGKCLPQFKQEDLKKSQEWLVHSCSIFLCCLDGEIQYRVATPYMRGFFLHRALGAILDQNQCVFLQKKQMSRV